jgi:hypothetical protein
MISKNTGNYFGKKKGCDQDFQRDSKCIALTAQGEIQEFAHLEVVWYMVTFGGLGP